mgnify:CR=1 FL=1
MEALTFVAKILGFIAAIAVSMFVAVSLYFGYGIGGCDLPSGGHMIMRFLCSYAGFFVVMAVLGLLPVWAFLLFRFLRSQESAR